MTNKTPSGARKHHKGTKPGTHKMGQMFFFFLLSSSVRLAQYCVNLSRWFTHETAAFCTEQCTTSSRISTSKSREALITACSNPWLSVWYAIFDYLYTCALKDHLATKRISTQAHWIRNTVVACTWAWDWKTGVCVLSIEQGTWIYPNEWMNEWMNKWSSENVMVLALSNSAWR